MLTILTIIFPIFLLICCGWFVRRTNLVGKAATTELNKFVVLLALPALLFDIVANAQWQQLWQPGFVVLFTFSTFVIFLIIITFYYLKSKRLASATMLGLNATYANTGFIGFPLVIAVVGEDAKPLVLIATLITACALFAVAIFLLEVNKKNTASNQPQTSILLRLMKNPILMSPVCAGIFPLTGLQLPEVVHTSLQLLGAAAAPCALITIGLFLAEPHSSRGFSPSGIYIVLTKLVIHPAIVILLAHLCFDLSPVTIYCAVLLAALPTGTGPFMLAEQYGTEAPITAESILLSTLLAPATLAGTIMFFSP